MFTSASEQIYDPELHFFHFLICIFTSMRVSGFTGLGMGSILQYVLLWDM